MRILASILSIATLWLSPSVNAAELCDRFPARLLCVTSAEINTENKEITNCRKPDQETVRLFTLAFDQLPKVLKNEICDLSSLRIHEKQSERVPGGRSVIYRNPDQSFNFNISVNRDFLGLQSIDSFETNKLLRLFGQDSPNPFGPVPKNLGLETHSSSLIPDKKVEALVSMLIHELGHIVEVKYIGIENRIACRGIRARLVECVTKPGTFFSISWAEKSLMDMTKPDTELEILNSLRPGLHFSFLNQICFYFECKFPKISPNKAGQLFNELRSLPFVSLYALSDPGEDFAETWTEAWYYKLFRGRWQISLKKQTVFDSLKQRDLPAYQPKLAFIESLVEVIEHLQHQKNSPGTYKSF